MKNAPIPIRRLAGALLSAAILLAPLGARAADPIEINVILPQTGSGSFIGKEEAGALGVIESLVNKSGGIKGRPIAFTIQDDATNPQTAVQLLNAVIGKHVPVVIGSALVAVCSAMMPLVKSGPFQYCLSPGVHPQPGSYTFSGSMSTTDLLAASARYFAGRGWRRIAMITSTDATGQDAERNIDASFTVKAGFTIVAREYFAPTDVSVAAQMARIKASGAQALIAWSTGTPVATLFRGVADSGLDVPVLTTNGNATYAQMKAYAAFLPRQLYFPGPPVLAPESVPPGRVRNAIAAYVAAFKAAGIAPDMGQTLAWDPALLIIEALKALGPDADATQIRDYLAALRSWDGVNGHYDFLANPQRGVGVDSVTIDRWDASKGTWVGMSKPGGTPL